MLIMIGCNWFNLVISYLNETLWPYDTTHLTHFNFIYLLYRLTGLLFLLSFLPLIFIFIVGLSWTENSTLVLFSVLVRSSVRLMRCRWPGIQHTIHKCHVWHLSRPLSLSLTKTQTLNPSLYSCQFLSTLSLFLSHYTSPICPHTTSLPLLYARTLHLSLSHYIFCHLKICFLIYHRL